MAVPVSLQKGIGRKVVKINMKIDRTARAEEAPHRECRLTNEAVTLRLRVTRIGPGFSTRVESVKKPERTGGEGMGASGVWREEKVCQFRLIWSPSPRKVTIFDMVVRQVNHIP